MHPDIKKFWEYGGYKVVCATGTRGDVEAWLVEKAAEQSFCVALIYTDDTPSNYWFSLSPAPRYSEDEALRMIKLKAFW